MNPIDYCKGMETKLIAWKAKMYDLTRKIANRGSEEREKVLHNIQDLNMPITEMSSLTEQLKNVLPTEWTPQRKNIDNGSVEIRSKYVLRPRLSWTGLYGKEPWPRQRKAMGEGLKKLGRGAGTTGVRPRADRKLPRPLGVTTEGWGQRWSVAGTQEGSGASPVFAANPWKLSRGNWGYPDTLLENLGVLK